MRTNPSRCTPKLTYFPLLPPPPPKADTKRPAYAVCLDHTNKNVVW